MQLKAQNINAGIEAQLIQFQQSDDVEINKLLATVEGRERLRAQLVQDAWARELESVTGLKVAAKQKEGFFDDDIDPLTGEEQNKGFLQTWSDRIKSIGSDDAPYGGMEQDGNLESAPYSIGYTAPGGEEAESWSSLGYSPPSVSEPTELESYTDAMTAAQSAPPALTEPAVKPLPDFSHAAFNPKISALDDKSAQLEKLGSAISIAEMGLPLLGSDKDAALRGGIQMAGKAGGKALGGLLGTPAGPAGVALGQAAGGAIGGMAGQMAGQEIAPDVSNQPTFGQYAPYDAAPFGAFPENAGGDMPSPQPEQAPVQNSPRSIGQELVAQIMSDYDASRNEDLDRKDRLIREMEGEGRGSSSESDSDALAAMQILMRESGSADAAMTAEEEQEEWVQGQLRNLEIYGVSNPEAYPQFQDHLESRKNQEKLERMEEHRRMTVLKDLVKNDKDWDWISERLHIDPEKGMTDEQRSLAVFPNLQAPQEQ
jgi:hypothetical protein